jgi:epoxyqueuosine reductase
VTPADTTTLVLDLCDGLGFALVGVADAGPSRRENEFRDWLAAGKHGSMAYLARNVETRLDPARVLPGARSVVMVADIYRARMERGDPVRGTPIPSPPLPHGRIAGYAQGRDYHVAMKKRLHRLCDALRERFPHEGFRAFVDTAPVPERELAARAGLGWIGKHTLLINPRLGSALLLGGVLTTLNLTSAAPPVADHCGTCTRCIDACPTAAITPYSVDASRCISELTIERRGPIDPAFHAAIGSWTFGCDVCQDVCPHNSPRSDGAQGERGRVRDDYRPVRLSFDLLALLRWTPEDRSRELSGSPIKRATLAMLKRNALIALGNALTQRPDPALVEHVRRVSEDDSEPELVRRTAREVLDRTLPEHTAARGAPPPAPAPATTPAAR